MEALSEVVYNFKKGCEKMLFRDRVKIANEYRLWLVAEREGDKFIIEDCPESFLAFLQTKGYLKEDKILKDTRKGR